MKSASLLLTQPLDAINGSFALKKVPSQVNVLPANPFQDLGVQVNEAEGSLRPKRDLSKISYFSLSLKSYDLLW